MQHTSFEYEIKCHKVLEWLQDKNNHSTAKRLCSSKKTLTFSNNNLNITGEDFDAFVECIELLPTINPYVYDTVGALDIIANYIIKNNLKDYIRFKSVNGRIIKKEVIKNEI